MKKLIFLFASVLFASPFVASAAIGADCSVIACGAGEYCDTTNNLYLCTTTPPPANNTSQTTGTGNFVPLAPIPGLTGPNDQPTSDMATFLNNLYKFLIGFAAAAAVVEIIWGGLEYATQDNVSKKSDGKARITQAILGLILVLMPVLVFSIINPSILNLSVAWQPLNLPGKAGGSTGGGATNATTTQLPSGVNKTVTGTYLQTGTFTSSNPAANNAAATAWVAQCGGVWSAVLVTSSCATYTNGTCSSPPAAIAQCVLKPSVTANFYDVETGWLSNATFQYLLKPVDTTGSQYLATCQADKGTVCAHSLPSAQTCPQGLAVPSGAPNASGGGNCYQVSPLCIPNVSATLPGTVVGVVGGGVVGGPVGAIAGGVVGNTVGPVTVTTHANPFAWSAAGCRDNTTFTP